METTLATLKETLLSDDNFPKLILDCKTLIDTKVAQKRGMKGLAIKAGYKAVKKFRPDTIERTLESLLPEFVDKMEPFWGEFHASGDSSMRTWMGPRRTEISTALLGITDGRAKNTKFAALRSAYNKLRPMAQENVEDALPDVADLVQRYADKG